MSKTSSTVKDRYNSKTYNRYTFYIRKDEALNDAFQESRKTQSVSEIVKTALTQYYNKRVADEMAAAPEPTEAPDGTKQTE